MAQKSPYSMYRWMSHYDSVVSLWSTLAAVLRTCQSESLRNASARRAADEPSSLAGLKMPGVTAVRGHPRDSPRSWDYMGPKSALLRRIQEPRGI